MKYTALVQIKNYLCAFKKIDFIRRVDDNLFKISFDKEELFFDLNRSCSGIYKAQILEKTYKAPFDLLLKKYFTNSTIKDICVLENNRILRIQVNLNKAYKSFDIVIYFEFTGKNTNAIITDEKDIILSALRYSENSLRSIKVGAILQKLDSIEIKEKKITINNFDEYFKHSFNALKQNELINLKAQKESKIKSKIVSVKKIFDKLENEESLLKQAQDLSLRADIIFSNLHNIKDYERNFTLKDFNGKEFVFNLDKTAKISANDFYKQAKKLKQKAKNLHLQRENLRQKIENLEVLLDLIKMASSKTELEILLPNKEKFDNKEEKNKSVLNFYFNGFKISAGKNEKANEYLLKNSKKDDLWFHIKNFSSAHIFIHSNKTKISDDVIQFASKLCVNLSNLARGSYLVDYTQRKFVKIRQKAFVNYTNFKSLTVIKE